MVAPSRFVHIRRNEAACAFFCKDFKSQMAALMVVVGDADSFAFKSRADLKPGPTNQCLTG